MSRAAIAAAAEAEEEAGEQEDKSKEPLAEEPHEEPAYPAGMDPMGAGVCLLSALNRSINNCFCSVSWMGVELMIISFIDYRTLDTV